MRDFPFISDADAQCLSAWWEWLDDNRADRARLRRAQSPVDILLTPAFAHFLRRMPEHWSNGVKAPLSEVAAVAALVSRVRVPIASTKDLGKSTFAASLARPKESGGKAVMSELRFQQLQKSRNPEDFFRRMCGALSLLGGKANISSVANDTLHWHKEYRAAPARKAEDRLAIRWASDYYLNLKD